MTNSPILLLIFNRPDVTALVMKTIRDSAPSRLYVAADGPRDRPDEAERCQHARQIATSVDWPWWRSIPYSGIGTSGSGSRSARRWIGSLSERKQVSYSKTIACHTGHFFPYCDELLDRYRHDTRIMAISGDNFQTSESSDPYSYYFSRYFHCWGWATWRRGLGLLRSGYAIVAGIQRCRNATVLVQQRTSVLNRIGQQS